MTSLRQQWMHWVANTQYCTVHGGKTQRREQDRNQEVSAAQHQERKEWGDCKHLLQGRGKRRQFCFYRLFLNGKLRVSLQLWCAKSSKESPAGRPLPPLSPALPSSHQIVQHNRFIGLGPMLGDDSMTYPRRIWQYEIGMAERGCHPRRLLAAGESGMSACRKMDFIWDGTFTYFDPKDVMMSKFDFFLFVFRSQRGNLLPPT